MHPGATSLRSQARAYARALSGKASLNLKATPLPITPTQLTVLTSASASSPVMSPVLYLIIGAALP